jgi:hypothetical protein
MLPQDGEAINNGCTLFTTRRPAGGVRPGDTGRMLPKLPPTVSLLPVAPLVRGARRVAIASAAFVNPRKGYLAGKVYFGFRASGNTIRKT